MVSWKRNKEKGREDGEKESKSERAREETSTKQKGGRGHPFGIDE